MLPSKMRAALVAFALLPAFACGADDTPDDGPRAGATPGTPAASSVQAKVTGTGASGLRIREQPTTASAQIGALSEGEVITIDCQIEGENINGNVVWNRIANEGGGYIADAFVDGPRGFAKGARRCSTAAPKPMPMVDGGTVDIEGPDVRAHVQVFANDACTLQTACKPSTYVGHSPSADLALDFLTSNKYGEVASDGDAFGDRFAAFAVDNRTKYRIDYVIYRQRINSGSGWRAMEDRGSITQNHYDHVHVSFDP
jgi:hypothetical protein